MSITTILNKYKSLNNTAITYSDGTPGTFYINFNEKNNNDDYKVPQQLAEVYEYCDGFYLYQCGDFRIHSIDDMIKVNKLYEFTEPLVIFGYILEDYICIKETDGSIWIQSEGLNEFYKIEDSFIEFLSKLLSVYGDRYWAFDRQKWCEYERFDYIKYI